MRRRGPRRRTGLALLLLVASLVLGACTTSPDTAYAPDPEPVASPLSRPFAGARLAVDPDTAAARYQRTRAAPWLSAITGVPQARWLNGPRDLAAVPGYVTAARAQGALPVLVAYDIPDRSCDGFKEGAPSDDFGVAEPRPDSYAAFVRGLVRQLGGTRSVIVLEPDALSADCYTPARGAVLKQATLELERAGHYVYLDAGHAGWRSSGETAQRLLDAGVTTAEGFSLNVSSRATPASTARYGEEISELVGGRDYVVDVGRAGVSAAAPAGVDPGDWCNPPNQVLGPRPTTQGRPAEAPHLAATLWIKPPGESDGNFGPEIGNCHGETTPPGEFSPEQARTLIANDPTVPPGVRAALPGVRAALPAAPVGP